MRLRRKPFHQNLDSLLDTLANVVGILIITIVVTLINLQNMPPMPKLAGSSDALDRARSRAADIHGLLDQLQRRWTDLQPVATQGRAALQQLQAELERRQAQSAAPAEPPADESELAALDTLLNERQKVRGRLQEQIESAQKQATALHGRLGRPAEAPQVKTVTLPNPRVSAAGTEPIYVLCRFGRVHVLPDSMREVLLRALQEAAGQTTLSPETLSQDLGRYFQQHDVGDGNLLFKLTGGELSLQWQNRLAGEPVDQIKKSGSAFQRAVRGLSPNRNYFTYFVWSDSFDAYLEARRISDSRNIAAGWEVFSIGRELKVSLNSGSATRPKRLD